MKLLNYIFYKISRPYRRFLAPNNPALWASGMFAVLLLWNIATLALIVYWAKGYSTPNYIIVTVSTAIFIAFHFMFDNSKLLELEEKYKKEPRVQKIIGGLAVLLYFIATLASFVFILLFLPQFLSGRF